MKKMFFFFFFFFFLASFILGSALFLISLSFIMCGVFEIKELCILKIEQNINAHDSFIKNGQVHHWSLKIKCTGFLFRNTLLN